MVFEKDRRPLTVRGNRVKFELISIFSQRWLPHSDFGLKRAGYATPLRQNVSEQQNIDKTSKFYYIVLELFSYLLSIITMQQQQQ